MRRIPERYTDLAMIALVPFWLVFCIVTFFPALLFGAYGRSFWSTYIVNLKGLPTPKLTVWWKRAKDDAAHARWHRDMWRMHRRVDRLHETMRRKSPR